MSTLFRQERLEVMARKFDRKAKLRETWLREMNGVLQDFEFGKSAAQVEASLKKQQAIAADVIPRVSWLLLKAFFSFLIGTKV